MIIPIFFEQIKVANSVMYDLFLRLLAFSLWWTLYWVSFSLKCSMLLQTVLSWSVAWNGLRLLLDGVGGRPYWCNTNCRIPFVVTRHLIRAALVLVMWECWRSTKCGVDAAGQRPRLCLPSLGTKLFPGHSNDGAAFAPKHSSTGVKYGGCNPLVNGTGGTSCVGENDRGKKCVSWLPVRTSNVQGSFISLTASKDAG